MQAPQSGRKQASAVRKAVGLQKHEPERHREEVVLPDGCIFRAEYFESQAQKLSVQDPYVHRRAIFLFIVFLSAAALLFGYEVRRAIMFSVLLSRGLPTSGYLSDAILVPVLGSILLFHDCVGFPRSGWWW